MVDEGIDVSITTHVPPHDTHSRARSTQSPRVARTRHCCCCCIRHNDSSRTSPHVPQPAPLASQSCCNNAPACSFVCSGSARSSTQVVDALRLLLLRLLTRCAPVQLSVSQLLHLVLQRSPLLLHSLHLLPLPAFRCGGFSCSRRCALSQPRFKLLPLPLVFLSFQGGGSGQLCLPPLHFKTPSLSNFLLLLQLLRALLPLLLPLDRAATINVLLKGAFLSKLLH